MTAEILKPFGAYRTRGRNESVIENLKEILARAELGEITGFALVVLNDNGDVDTLTVAGNHGFPMLAGSVACLQDDLMRKWKPNG